MVSWLEDRLSPVLQVNTYEDAVELLQKVMRRELWPFEQAVLEHTWQTNWRKGSFNNVIDLHQFIVPTTSVSSSSNWQIWKTCFDLLYGEPT